MHPGAQAARLQSARDRITAGLDVLADRDGIEFPVRQTNRDPGVQALFDMEWCADVLDALTVEERPFGAMSDALQGKVSVIKERLEGIDDVAVLQGLAEEEAEGGGRKGVAKAIAERLEVLEAADEPEPLAEAE